MRAPGWILSIICLSYTAVHATITQQDPNVNAPSKVDPRNHYFLSEKEQTPAGPASRNGTFVHHPAPPNAVAFAAAPTTSTGALMCGPNSPCIDGSCCGKNNICGFGDDYCGSGCQNGCKAKALCGRDSEGGHVSCGMNLCCSYYGWCGVTADYCTPGKFGCQQGFGSCETHTPFQCDASAASATKRTIGYYQGGDVYSTGGVCSRVRASEIAKHKYTHLYWAFAEINPTTFEVRPANPRDTDLYADFTSLKSAGKLETWIGIGGFDFTTANPGAWTDMVSSAASRQAFIRSLVTFMTRYGFQGVDLDWEYPVDAKRGGHPNDMVNLVQLLADMRANPDFGHKFGISVTLAPDLWYLQYFDAKGLLANADWLGFMSYDLHGIWDADVPNLGKVVYGQTDLRDIQRDLIPLWYDLTPADMNRVNFGLALYGRGYTLADPACNRADGNCTWTAGNRPGPCTATEGVMSLVEIEALINEKGLVPVPLDDGTEGDSTMKQITWDDQWIGYDDEETIRAKTNFASSHCFGGTMSWSVDLEVGNVDVIRYAPEPPEYTNPDGKTIWDEAPQFQNDSFPPYPSLTDPDGNPLSIENLRGVHLFGWKGCTDPHKTMISQTYDDFYKLAQQPELYNNIDWSEQVITEFFGPNDKRKIPDDTRAEIQQIYAAAQQVYNYPWTWEPPWLGWRRLWIEIRCSSNLDTGADPGDKCGDRANHAPPQCPPPSNPKPPSNNNDERLEAFSEPNEKYSRITFCSKFFDLPTLSESINNNKNKPLAITNSLPEYDSRARCFFHEVTHLDYFMNANDSDTNSKSPEVFDAQFTFKSLNQLYDAQAYGPYHAKILRNWIPRANADIGYYTQRNADTYAWVAVAKYVQSQLGLYPSDPSPGNIKPVKPPTKSPGGSPLFAGTDIGSDDDSGLLSGPINDDGVANFSMPGCGDRYDTTDGVDTEPPDGGWPVSLGVTGNMGNSPYPSAAGPTRASSTPQPAPSPPGPTPSHKPVTCNVDCGSEITPIIVCHCSCSDGRRYRITKGSAPCVP